MKKSEIIAGLEDLIKDSESFIDPDADPDEPFVHDKAVLQAAVDFIRCATPNSKSLTLYELRKMDGETVRIPDTDVWRGGCGTVNVARERVIDNDDARGHWRGHWPFDRYGDWLAFRAEDGKE